MQNWSDDQWTVCWAADGGSNEDISVALIIWDQFFISVLFKDILGTISLIMHCKTTCWLDLDSSLTFTMEVISIFIQLSTMDGLIPGGHNLSRRQCVFFLPVVPRKEDHKAPEYIDYSAPRHARYLQNAWKKHQDTVFWIDIDLGIREGLKFCQARSNAIILQGTLPANCIVRAERLKTGELYEKQYLSPRPPRRSLWNPISIGPEGMMNWAPQLNINQSENSFNNHLEKHFKLVLPNQPKIHWRWNGATRYPRVVGKLQEELCSSDRLGQADREERLHKVQEDNHLKNRDDADKFNLAMDDENIDFNISGVPDATVKRSQSINIHDLISKVNHKKKPFKIILNNINHSIPSATSHKLQSWKRETLRFPRLSTALQIEQGNLWNYLKTFASCMLTMEQGNLWNRAQTHAQKEQFVPAEHRDIASSNADNKFNLAIDVENIDFNISGVPNAMVKRSHGVNVHNWIQQIENHPQRQALQSDLQQHRAFNPFCDESKVAIMAVGNTEICEIINVEPKWQCKVCLKSCNTGIRHCTCGQLVTDDSAENRKYISAVLVFSPYRTSASESTCHTVTGVEKHLTAKISLPRINLQRNVVKRSTTASTTDSSATKPSGRRWLKWDALKRSSRRWISLQVKMTLTKSIKKRLTSTVAIGGFTQMWHTSIQHQQGANLISKRRRRQCTASSKRKTKTNMPHGRTIPPLLLGNGIQAGGSGQVHFHPNCKKKLIQKLFHPKTLSSNDTIQKRFRPMTFSSWTIFIQPQTPKPQTLEHLNT